MGYNGLSPCLRGDDEVFRLVSMLKYLYRRGVCGIFIPNAAPRLEFVDLFFTRQYAMSHTTSPRVHQA